MQPVPPPSFRKDTQGDAKPAYIARLHAEAPLYRDANGHWVLSRFEDLRALLLDHAHFSSAIMSDELPMLSDDPPRHSHLRALVNKAFTPARIEALRPEIEVLARQLVGALPAGTEVDVVGALTTPLPVAVIGRLLGVPEVDHPRFKRWSEAIVGLLDDPSGGERMATLRELRAYFMALVAQRRAAPGTDLVSAIASAEDAGVQLDDDGVAGFINLLLLAGNETTTNLLSNLLDQLSRRPADWQRLRGNVDAIEGAIEEALRLESPAQYVVRVAREDVDLCGQRIRAGERVIAYLAAGNRDPGKWAQPEHFDIARERERHLAFGHGVHFCLGAPLARLEALAVMQALTDRFSRIEPGSTPPVRLATGLFFGFRALPLRLFA